MTKQNLIIVQILETEIGYIVKKSKVLQFYTQNLEYK